MYLSIPTAAQRLGYSFSTLHRSVKEGCIRVYRATPKRHPRVKIVELEALIKDEQTITSATPDVDDYACQKMGLVNRYKRQPSVH